MVIGLGGNIMLKEELQYKLENKYKTFQNNHYWVDNIINGIPVIICNSWTYIPDHMVIRIRNYLIKLGFTKMHIGEYFLKVKQNEN